MIGTLILPSATPLRLSSQNIHPFLAQTTRSGRKMLFPGRNPCKAVLHAFADTAPAVGTRQQQQGGSLYEVLRVNRNASPTEIKMAYRNLAKLYHPDASVESSSSDGRDFIEIHNAYATLSDPAARDLYDLSLATGSRPRPFGYPADGYRSGFYTTRRWETDQCW